MNKLAIYRQFMNAMAGVYLATIPPWELAHKGDIISFIHAMAGVYPTTLL